MSVVSTTVFAGRVEGKIERIQAGYGYTTENVYFLVKVNASREAKPACATDDRMSINPSTEAGKVIVSMLMAAHAAGQTVEIAGNGNCTLMGGDFETISYLRIK